MMENRDNDAEHRRLYDLRDDPEQLENVADHPSYADVKRKLARQLTAELRATGDPRIIGGGEKFDEYPYLGGGPKHPSWEGEQRRRRRGRE